MPIILYNTYYILVKHNSVLFNIISYMFWLDYLYNTDLSLTEAYSSFTVLIHAMG